MEIKLKDDILTYVNLENEIEEPMSEFQYSFEHTSKLSLHFKRLGYRQVVFKQRDSTPVEMYELINFLIEDVIDNKKLLTIGEFSKLMSKRFLNDRIEFEVY